MIKTWKAFNQSNSSHLKQLPLNFVKYSLNFEKFEINFKKIAVLYKKSNVF